MLSAQLHCRGVMLTSDAIRRSTLHDTHPDSAFPRVNGPALALLRRPHTKTNISLSLSLSLSLHIYNIYIYIYT